MTIRDRAIQQVSEAIQMDKMCWAKVKDRAVACRAFAEDQGTDFVVVDSDGLTRHDSPSDAARDFVKRVGTLKALRSVKR